MRRILRVFNRIDSGLFTVAQIVVILMMLVTTFDSIFRYLLKKGIPGAYEFTADYLMVALVFLSISYVWKMGGHINIDILYQRFPTKLKKFLSIIYMLLIAGLMFGIGYQAMIVTVEAYVNNYVSAGIVRWPTWLSWVWIPIGSYIFTIRLTLTALIMLFTKDNLFDDEGNIEI
jgi:TRAP-type C4-dicarboxylate transport system permease small subunit